MAKKIMIQGTMSNAGKSLICAGLCRIFKQDGYKVAPFKSQNMALNSFITEDGLEMGRAQVVQAEAAGIAPRVQMNPILLKPTNDTGSQVIVNGEVLKNMSARDYFAYKKQLIPDIMKAFHELEEAYDIIVIEGAGSPAEINLKQDDIVNMGLAKMVDAPVLLVGDIDRGGVFAQLLGTLMLLEDDEKERVKGLIINKFRGDKTILDPGIDMLKEKGGIPIVGVTPYLQVDIEDEDSLTERLTDNAAKGLLDIAVIRLPRISNFSDFLGLENTQGISLRYVDRSVRLGTPDMIVIPGTKNTMEDLKWLRQSGLEAEILKSVARGTPLWGICGGYQMLGETLCDPEGVEAGGSMKGLGLLPIDTVFTGNKTRTRVTGIFKNVEGIFAGLKNVLFEGYEIHMGETRLRRDAADSCLREGPVTGPAGEITDSVTGRKREDGVCCGNVYGTYVHGVFDREDVVQKIIEALAEKKGIASSDLRSVDLKVFKERQYDLLADSLREHLDMEKVYEVMGISL